MSEDLARARFLVIQLARLGGVAMILAGMLVFAGKLDLPREAGFILAIAGLFETFFVPLMLARRWRSPRP